MTKKTANLQLLNANYGVPIIRMENSRDRLESKLEIACQTIAELKIWMICLESDKSLIVPNNFDWLTPPIYNAPII